jgi:hypothetical protein
MNTVIPVSRGFDFGAGKNTAQQSHHRERFGTTRSLLKILAGYVAVWRFPGML